MSWIFVGVIVVVVASLFVSFGVLLSKTSILQQNETNKEDDTKTTESKNHFLKPVFMLTTVVVAVWLYEPKNTIAFAKEHYDTAGLFLIAIFAFVSAKKEVDRINLWTIPLALYNFVFLFAVVLGVLSIFK